MADNDSSESQRPKSLQPTKTPEPRLDQQMVTGNTPSNTPSTPGVFPSFDWEEFEARYEKALAEADEKERELLLEFDSLVKVRSSSPPVWAYRHADHCICSTSTSGHPLQVLTTTNVQLSVSTQGRDMSTWRRRIWLKGRSTVSHHSLTTVSLRSTDTSTVTEVLRAFQSALALLSRS